jgi:hypothetical protein
MNVFSVSYSNTFDGPTTDAVLTQYMWPGFLGEFNHDTLEFIVWELSTATTWIRRTDIPAPPLLCLASETIGAKISINSEAEVEWTNLAPNVWRCVSPLSK